MLEITPLRPTDASKWLPQLIVLLQDAVDSGASVGFLAPLADIDAYHYWMQAFVQHSEKSRIILAAVHNGTLVSCRPEPSWHRLFRPTPQRRPWA